MLTPAWRAALDRLGADRTSGATALVLEGIGILCDAADDRAMLRVVARELCVRQPSMAGFQTAAAIALAAADPRQALEALATRIGRAPRAIARHAVPLLRLRTPGTSRLRIVTCSRSDAVERTLLALNQAESIEVSCAESRPAREGVALAAALLEAGVSTHLYSDAGLSAAIPGASALVVGADAVSDVGFINKVGTAGLAALAQASGVPVLVLAGREKLVPAPVFAGLMLHADADSAIAPEHPRLPQLSPLFERIQAELTSQLVTDGGVLEVRDASEAGLWPFGAGLI